MKHLAPLKSSLYLALTLWPLLPNGGAAAPLPDRAIQFSLCSANIKNIILAKVPGNDSEWEFVITLNGLGTEEFRQLEFRRPGMLVDIVWDGVSFGRRRLDLPVPSDAKKLVLGSNWLSYDTAQAQFDLLNKNLLRKRTLNSPCGAA